MIMCLKQVFNLIIGFNTFKRFPHRVLLKNVTVKLWVIIKTSPMIDTTETEPIS